MKFEKIRIAKVKAQDKLAHQKVENERLASENVSSKAYVENLQKEIESAKSSKYKSRFKFTGKSHKLINEFVDGEEDVDYEDEPQSSKDDDARTRGRDPLARCLKFLEK